MTKEMGETGVGRQVASQALELAVSSYSTLAAMLGLSTYVEPARSRPAAPCLPRFTLQHVADHCWANDCWLVLYDRVYDVTEFVQQHPGGADIMLESAGRDATTAFAGVGHSQSAADALQKYQIGLLVDEQCMWPPQ